MIDRCRGWDLSTRLDLVKEEDEEDPMSNYYYGPALDSEIGYRRDSLIRDAAVTRLARQAREPAGRAAARLCGVRPVPAPVEVPAGDAGGGRLPAGTDVTRAA